MVIPMEPPKERETKERKKVTYKAFNATECFGYGHIQAERLNYKKFKGNATNVTLSDESDFDDSKIHVDKNEHIRTFTASVKSRGESSVSASPDLVELSQDDSNDDDNLQVAYDKLFEEYSKLIKLNKIKVFN